MHHQLRMSVGHGFTDFADQRNARLDRGCVLSGIVEQRHALHVLEHQKRLAEQTTGVDQPRNAGVIQPCEQRPFLRKPRFKLCRLAISTQKFDRCFGLKQTVRSRCEPNLAHAADANDFLQFPRATHLARVSMTGGARPVSAQRSLQQAVKALLVAAAKHRCHFRGESGWRVPHHVGDQRLRVGAPQQLAHFLRQSWVTFVESLDKRRARQVVAFEGVVERGIDCLPEHRVEVVGALRDPRLRGRHRSGLGRRHGRWSSSVSHRPRKDEKGSKTASVSVAARTASLRRNVKPFRQ